MSFLVYDYECFGLNPAKDSVAQFAGVRLGDDFQPIDKEMVFYCKPAIDALPSPDAVLLTGITPQYAMAHGLPEPQFIANILAEMSQPNTCSFGYNSIRFDDEFTRHLAYRNFHDPYAHHYANGNSRFDLLDVMRATYALRPEGIEWAFNDEGLPSFKLEDLSRANGIFHENAHDAMADVWATVALLQLLHEKQPKLLNHALNLRSKALCLQMLQEHQFKPLLHVSGMFGAARSYVAWVMPLAKHPSNTNAWIVCDLAGEVDLLALDVPTLQQRLFSKEQSALGRVPLKLIHANKCPFIAPANTLRTQDAERLDWDRAHLLAQAERVRQMPDVAYKVKALYDGEFLGYNPELPAREQLYAGFLKSHDQALCAQITQSALSEIAAQPFDFHDARLKELWWEYRARYAFHTLSRREQLEWQETVRKRLEQQVGDYAQRLQELASSSDLNERQFALLQQLYDWAKRWF